MARLDVNGDLTARAQAVPTAMPWEAVEDGVLEKVYERLGAHRTALVKLTAGARLPPWSDGALDILVLGGDLREGDVVHGANTFLHTRPVALRAQTECTLFVKHRPVSTPRLVLDIRRVHYHPTQNAGVRAGWLFDEGDCAALLFHCAPASTIAHHHHDSREELLILGGEMGDEHGTYAPFVWVRQPIGSAHTVQTTAGCLFLAFAHRPQG